MARTSSKRTVSSIEAEIKKLQAEKEELIKKEKEEIINELYEIILNSSLSLSQIKKAIVDAEKAKSKKPKRVRRTKVQIEADKKAKAAKDKDDNIVDFKEKSQEEDSVNSDETKE